MDIRNNKDDDGAKNGRGADLGDRAVLLAAALGSGTALERLRRVVAPELAGAPRQADPRDIEQAVWLRMLEHLAAGGSPGRPEQWVRRAAREEVALAAVEHRAAPMPTPRRLGPPAERCATEADLLRRVREAAGCLSGRCPELVGALLSSPSLTYREMAHELGISQGSIGPLRSRCVASLRRLLSNRGCIQA